MKSSNIKSQFLKSFVLGSSIVLAMGGSAFASCQSEDAACKRTCLSENFGNLLGQLSCNLECGNVTMQCYKDENSSSNTNRYSRKTYEAPSRSSYNREKSYNSQSSNYTRPQRSSSTSSRNSEVKSRSRDQLRSELSQKGGAEAKRCISTRRGRAAGTDGLLILKNSCSETVNYSWCYTRYTDSSRRNSYKCDLTGSYSFSAAGGVKSFDEKWLHSSHGAQVRYGVCMADVQLDGKTYGHISTKRTGDSKYSCNYSTYGR